MRMIDADVAIENIEEWLNCVGTALIGKGLSYTGELMGCIEDSPTVDAVPVVRCRECKFRKPTFSGEYYFCTVWDADESETAYVTDYDFCSYGERKEGAD